MDSPVTGCAICDIVDQRRTSPGGVLAITPEWVVTHHPSAAGRYPGRIMVSLRRHMGRFSQFTPAEAATFGQVISAVSGAIEAVLNPARVYVVSFNEHSTHVHAHLLARFEDDTELGPEIVLRRMREEVCSFDEATPVALAIKAKLAESLPG